VRQGHDRVVRPARANRLGASLSRESVPLTRVGCEQTGAEVDRAGLVQVLPDCSLPGHPEVFVVDDLMSLDRLPGVAEVAMQSGRHAAKTIVRRLRGDAKATAVPVPRSGNDGDDF
jgi:NADH dehydrogenase FAD-containing subunit